MATDEESFLTSDDQVMPDALSRAWSIQTVGPLRLGYDPTIRSGPLTSRSRAGLVISRSRVSRQR